MNPYTVLLYLLLNAQAGMFPTAASYIKRSWLGYNLDIAKLIMRFQGDAFVFEMGAIIPGIKPSSCLKVCF